MLIINRRAGESFSIGDKVIVRVLDIERGQVRIGIEADRSIQILRDNAKKVAKRAG